MEKRTSIHGPRQGRKEGREGKGREGKGREERKKEREKERKKSSVKYG